MKTRGDETIKNMPKIDNSVTCYFKIEIISTGGEYSYGFINDEKKKNSLLSMIDEVEDIYPINDTVSFDDCDTQLFHVYGPNEEGAKVSITVYEDEECENEIEEILFQEQIDCLPIVRFISSNPYVSEELKKSLNNNSLVFGGYIIEKRIHFSAVVKIKENESFDINNVYVGSVLMDETLSNDEIVDKVLYIREDDAQRLLSLHDVEEEELSDYLGEIFSEMYETNEEVKEIIDRSTCETLDIVGKGISENQFAIIKNLDNEVLYEKELE